MSSEFLCRYEARIQKLSENSKSAEFNSHLDHLSSQQRQFVELILRNAKKKIKNYAFQFIRDPRRRTGICARFYHFLVRVESDKC